MPRPKPRPGKKPVSRQPTLDPIEAVRLRNAQAAAAKVASTGVPKPTPGGRGAFPTAARPTFGLAAASAPVRIPGIAFPRSEATNLASIASVGAGQSAMLEGRASGVPIPISTTETAASARLAEPTPATAVPAGPAQPAISELVNIKWKPTTFNVGSGNAPSWWAPKIPEDSANAADPRVNFLMTLNSMIPYLSPEDQRNAAAQLYSMDADNFSEYKPEKIQVAAPVTEETSLAAAREGTPAGPVINQGYFTSRERARDAINLLSQLREQTVGGNRWQISPAYTLLQQILGASEQFGGGGSVGKYGSYADTGRQTRSQFLAQQGALDPLLAQAKSGEAGGFGAIAQMLASPFFSQGALNPTYSGPGGRVLFGRPNQILGY